MTGAREVTVTHVSAQSLAVGALVAGRYRIEAAIGAGGMGVVYRARDEELGQSVALKVLREGTGGDVSSVLRLRRELVLARQVSHRNVVRIHDIGEHEGLRFLSMSLVEGRSLRALLEECGRLPPERALPIARQLADALVEAHDAGIVHRDLKPENVLVGEGDRIWVTDFGLARSASASKLTREGTVLGTVDYLAPEQVLAGEIDARADLYAFGLILFELLTGRLPFPDGSEGERLAQRAAGRAESLSDAGLPLPAALCRLVDRCLERLPARRFPDARAVAAQLEAIDPHGAPARSRRRVRRAAVTALALLAVAAGLLAYSRRAPPRTRVPAVTVAVRHAVAVLPFADETSDAALAWAGSGVSDALAAGLAEDPGLRVVDSDRVARTLRDLGIAPARVDDALLRQIAPLWDVDAVLLGTLRASGEAVRLDARLVRLDGAGPPVTTVLGADGLTRAALFTLASSLAARVRRELGSAPADTADSAAQSTVLAAVQGYAEGRALLAQGQAVAAIPALERATAADPRFATALERLAAAYEAGGRHQDALVAARRARDAAGSARSRLAGRVRGRVALLEGEPAAAEKVYADLLARYPNDTETRLDLASAQAAQGHAREAVASLRAVVSLDPNDGRAWYLLAREQIVGGRSAEAVADALPRALAAFRRQGNLQGQADILNATGAAYQQLGEAARARENYGSAVELRRKVGDTRGLATTLRNRALLAIRSGRTREAAPDLAQARALFTKLGNPRGLADVVNDEGSLHEAVGNYTAALAAYRESLRMRTALGDERLVAQSDDNVGYAYWMEGALDNATVYFQQALETRKRLGDDEGTTLSLQSLGFVAIAQGRLGEGIEAFSRALELARRTGSKEPEVVSLGNLAVIARLQGRYDAARQGLADTLAAARKIDGAPSIAEFTIEEATLDRELGLLAEAEGRLEAADRILASTGNHEQKAQLLVQRGLVRAARGDAAGARAALARAVTEARGSGGRRAQLQARIASAALAGGVDELRASLDEAVTLAHRALVVDAAEALATALLSKKRGGEAVGPARTALEEATRCGLEGRTFRLRSLLSSALAASGDGEGAARERAEASAAARKLRDALTPATRSAFEKLPSVRAALGAAS